MAPTTALSLLLSVVLLVCASTATTTTAPGPQLIRAACANVAPDQDLCFSSISSHPASAQADLRQLAAIAVRAADEKVADTAAFLSTLPASVTSSGTATDPVTDQCVNDCIELYVDASELLDMCAAAVDDERDADAANWVEAALSDVASCESGCGAVATAEMAKRNQGAKKQLNIGLSLAKLILSGKHV
ncbi:hypothetical protein HPP92_001968 [Vanilla planifolia]|uniref:Pectinesterase inhibitor domain-containing protein n=1 Tax=Vanilla planifolia TaxID=51239 RepID=A0A835RT16_VANPL|nr:hypothetical protein HPP92_002230 [Vanilla planifolia]KAG0501896.1 hypothetical protein HPP92_001968 [Vanilla planifolia]